MSGCYRSVCVCVCVCSRGFNTLCTMQVFVEQCLRVYVCMFV